jgi:hypothetical protein
MVPRGEKQEKKKRGRKEKPVHDKEKKSIARPNLSHHHREYVSVAASASTANSDR